MTVGFFCNRTVVICRGGDSVLEAARRMRAFNVGCVVVVEESGDIRRPIGLLTDRDIVVALAEDEQFVASQRQVGELMSKGVVTAREDEDLEDGLRRMRAFGVRRMPVVNADGGLEGLVTFDDLLELFAEEMGDMAQLLTRERRHPEAPAPEQLS